MALAQLYLSAVRREVEKEKRLAERAMAQLSDAELEWRPNEECNSIAVLVQHLGGNLASRWTDFLTSDGEKPWRDRDAEFVGAGRSREELMRDWERGWAALFATLDGLSAADLERTVTLRGKPVVAIDALEQNVLHAAHHAGQIVYIAKQICDRRWETLSIPRGQSRTFRRGSRP